MHQRPVAVRQEEVRQVLVVLTGVAAAGKCNRQVAVLATTILPLQEISLSVTGCGTKDLVPAQW